ncbi:MAG: sodium:solute symporter family protein [Planctomycetota bacterium]|jgi:SSS family solute:Na+ symporter|nr:sodium:solute symporter family protein [Planctomycetota bacterium]
MTGLSTSTAEVAGGYLPHILLGIYMLMLVGLCIVGYLKGKATEEDYYLAGRGQGTLVTSLTLMATFFSSAALLGIPGIVYRDGASFFLFALNLPVAGLAIYLLGDRMRKLGKARGYVTPADLVGDYYGGSAIRILAAITSALYVLPYVIMQVKAGGYLAQRLFPDTPPLEFLGSSFTMYESGVWALSLLTMAYVLVGGMRSVAWTDVIQGLLLLFGMMVAGLATLVHFGGLSGYFEAVADLPAKALSAPGNSGKWNAGMLCTICVFASLGAIIQPGQWMRFYAARSSDTLRRSSLVFAIVLPICFLFGIMLVALGGQVLFPVEITAEGVMPHLGIGSQAKEVDQVVIVMIQRVVPEMLGVTLGAIVVTLVLIAVLAASMSTADSNLHALSAVVTRDVYARFVRPRSGDRERTWVGRAVIVLTTMAAVILVEWSELAGDFNPLELISQLMLLAIAFSSQLLPIAIDVLFLNKGTRQGAVAGVGAGIVSVVLFTIKPEWSLGVTGFIDKSAVGIAVNVVVFVAVSRLTQKVGRERIDEFRSIIKGKG